MTYGKYGTGLDVLTYGSVGRRHWGNGKLASGVKTKDGTRATGSSASKSVNALAKSPAGTTAHVGPIFCLQPALPGAVLRHRDGAELQLHEGL